MDPLEAVFLFCFVFGLAMSGLSFVLGSLHLPGLGHHGAAHSIGDPHADVHAGHGGHAAAGHVANGGPAESAAEIAHQGPSPFNVNTATAFLAFFGGVGYVLYGTFGVAAAIALIGAVVAGLAGGACVFLFLVKVLLAGERYLDPADFRLEGSLAQVTRPIHPGGIGEIVYSKGGTRRSDGARSARGEEIPVGTEVVIVSYEQGVASVEPWKSFAEES
ncbi:MAG TPA: NfeD family protein [Chloroflexota bacterium]|nr:NfeD family protein [Chloroflexota bacterium]